MTKNIDTKHPHFRRCYDEGVAAQTTGEANPYVPGTDEHTFFEAGVEGKVFHETKEEVKTTLVASPAEANTDTSTPVTLTDSAS